MMKACYTQFNPEVVGAYIKEVYGFKNSIECRLFSSGMNDVYWVKIGGKVFYYRISTSFDNRKQDYEEEIEAILLFARHDIGIVKPVIMTNQRYVSEFITPEGTCYGILFEELKDNPATGNEKFKRLGENLARIHQVSDEFLIALSRNELDFTALRDEPLNKLEPYLKDIFDKESDYDYLCSTSQRLVEFVQSRIKMERPYYGFCHGDLHVGNVRFNDNQPMIFDFDCMGYGFRAYDICVYAWNELYAQHKYLQSNEWKSFLAGYEQIRKLTDAEKDCIIAFIALRQLWLMGLHADRNACCQWFNANYLEEQIELFKRYAQLL